ncbi:SURF1 family protein [soil metagenome]
MSYRLFLTPKWLLGHALALGLVVLFVNFGFWQLRRLDERQSYNTLLETRLTAPPEALAALLAEVAPGAAREPADAANPLAYRRALAEGVYDPAREVLLRSRSYNGNPGYPVLTPLVLDSGEALLVDRGWVPFAWDEPPVPGALTPEGRVALSGVLFPRQEQPGFGARDPATGELTALFWVDIERLGRQLPYPLVPMYLQLSAQAPAQPQPYPILAAPPVIDAGPHLGYALQWFSFALIGIVGYALLVRQVVQEARGKRAPAERALQGKA